MMPNGEDMLTILLSGEQIYSVTTEEQKDLKNMGFSMNTADLDAGRTYVKEMKL